MAKTTESEREEHILSTAAELFAHFGYDKTTIDQIAQAAGISHGAIYLHFDSKEALFEALLMRELATFAEQWFERIKSDPNGGTLGGMYKNMLYAIGNNAFMAAMFTHDRRILGKYVNKPNTFFKRFQSEGRHSARFEFVMRMQEAGALRDDLDPHVITHIMNMLAFGLVGLEDIIPSEDTPPLDNLIEGIAFMMDEAFTTSDTDKRNIGKEIVRQLVAESLQQQDEIDKSD